MNRKDILEAAIRHTCGERDVSYGSPIINMDNTAALIGAYLWGRTGGKPIGLSEAASNEYCITGEDAANILVLVKLARTHSPNVPTDTYEDLAAYAAIAGECRVAEDEE